MIDVKKFPKAYVEVEEILKYMPQEEYNKIEKQFISMIHKNRDNNYYYKIDETKELTEQIILKETKAILAYIFLNYLGTEYEKDRIKQQFKKDIILSEKRKQEQYPTDIFKEKQKNDEHQEKEIQNNQDMIIYKKENIITKIFNKIKKVLKFQEKT